MRRLTRPQIETEVPCTRAWFERVLRQYGDRLPPAEKFGATRTWPESILVDLRNILEAEARCAGGRR